MIKIVQKIKKKVKSKTKAVIKSCRIIINGIDTRESLFDYLTFLINRIKRSIRRFIESENKICYVLRNILGSRLIYMIIGVLLIMKMSIFYNEIEIEEEKFKPVYEASIIYASITLCVLWFIKKDKNRFRLAMLFNIIISIILFADCLYWKFSANMLSVSQVFYVKYAEEISSSISYYLEINQIYFFIDIPILFILWWLSKLPIIKKKTKIVLNKGKRRIIPASICLILLVGYKSKQMGAIFESMSDSPYLKYSQVERGSILGYHYLDLLNSFNAKGMTKYKTYNKMLEAYSKLENYSKEYIEVYDEFTGIAEERNVIVLQLESLQNFIVHREINGKEITPNLNKFLKENIEITNMISQSYSTTADSEYSMMTSLYPTENGQAFSMYSSNINNDIYKLFKNKGYNTYYFHGNVGEFWSRVNVYKRLKIDKVSYIDDFENTQEMINGYLSDELLYRGLVPKLGSYSEPFMVSIVAASSHTPFDLGGILDKDRKVDIDIGKYYDTQFGNYLEAANYADYAFGIFIDELKKNEFYDDCVIIVFGDHYGLNIDNEEMEEFIKEVNPNYNEISSKINYSNVICGMKIPEMDKMKIDYPVSKLDIKPTLLHILGIEDDFSLGKTMFSSKDYAYINIGSIVTRKYYYDNDEWYFIDTGKKVDEEELTDIEKDYLDILVDNMKLQLDISNSILINNLLK